MTESRSAKDPTNNAHEKTDSTTKPGKSADELARELRVKSVESANDWCKNLITLSTGTLVLSATFIKDVFSGSLNAKWLMVSSWIVLVLSILLGILFQGALVTLLADPDDLIGPDVYRNPGRILGAFQAVLFFLGLLTFAIFTILNF